MATWTSFKSEVQHLFGLKHHRNGKSANTNHHPAYAVGSSFTNNTKYSSAHVTNVHGTDHQLSKENRELSNDEVTAQSPTTTQQPGHAKFSIPKLLRLPGKRNVTSQSTSSSGNYSQGSDDNTAPHGKQQTRKARFSLGGQNLRRESNQQDQDDIMKPSDFEFLKVIGKGSFGKVLLAKKRPSNSAYLTTDKRILERNDAAKAVSSVESLTQEEPIKFYAIKVLDKELVSRRNETKHVMAERDVLVRAREMAHPFLVRFYASFTSRDKLFFVLDYANGGELFLHLQREKRFSECKTRFYCAEIASALGYLHSLDIIYRDLKPENILLDRSGHIKLTDFGLCKHCPDFDVLWALNNLNDELAEDVSENGKNMDQSSNCHRRTSDHSQNSDKDTENEGSTSSGDLDRSPTSEDLSQFKSTTWKHQLATTFCGTPEYLAPEILANSRAIRKQHLQLDKMQSDKENRETENKALTQTALPSGRLAKEDGKTFEAPKTPIYYYDRRVDWWCLGAVMYEMLFGLPPFYSRDTSKMYRAILTKPLTFPHDTHQKQSSHHHQQHYGNGYTSNYTQTQESGVSHQAKKLLRGLLEKDRENRLGSSKRDVKEIQEHPFFAEIDWEALVSLKIKPPYDPCISDNLDFRHIDPEFIEEPIPDSYREALQDLRWKSGSRKRFNRKRSAPALASFKDRPIATASKGSTTFCALHHHSEQIAEGSKICNSNIQESQMATSIQQNPGQGPTKGIQSNHHHEEDTVNSGVLVIKTPLPLISVKDTDTALIPICEAPSLIFSNVNGMPGHQLTSSSLLSSNGSNSCCPFSNNEEGTSDLSNSKKDSGFYCEFDDFKTSSCAADSKDNAKNKINSSSNAPRRAIFHFGGNVAGIDSPSDNDEAFDIGHSNSKFKGNSFNKSKLNESEMFNNTTTTPASFHVINNNNNNSKPCRSNLKNCAKAYNKDLAALDESTTKLPLLQSPTTEEHSSTTANHHYLQKICTCQGTFQKVSTNAQLSGQKYGIASPLSGEISDNSILSEEIEEGDGPGMDDYDEMRDSFRGFSFIQNSFDYEC